MSKQPAAIAPDGRTIGGREFIALIATLMAMTALGIDSMLPALNQIGSALDVASANGRQWVTSIFMFGFAAGQLVWGPLSDRYGRRPVLLVTLALGMVANLVAALSPDFTLLLVARFAGGVAVASSRVVAVALVRDLYSGRAMARVMSLAFIVFMAAPVIAPAVGQLVLLVAPWEWIFVLLAAASGLTLLWVRARLPETLADADRLPLSVTRLSRGARTVVTDRVSICYTLAMAAMLSALYGFINSVPQVLADVFSAGDRLAAIFATVAGTMAIANYLNARIVMRYGTRRISHLALIGFVVMASVHIAVSVAGAETLMSFAIVQAGMMGCFGLASSNFGAMAMEPMGRLAGTASSVQGFLSISLGSAGGAVIGQAFDGTTMPLYIGFQAGGLVALALVLVAERGRLFRGHHADAAG